MTAIDVTVGVLWAAFWVYWLGAAVATRSQSAVTRPYAGVGVRVIAVLLVLLALRVNVTTRRAGVVDSPAVESAGLVLFLAGLGLAVWARVFLGRNWGMPMSERASPELVVTGPYRHVRHPIYSGIILAMIGTALAVALYWLIVALVLGVYFVYSAGVEERTMLRRFPNTYPAYRRSTKMLIPFLL